MTADLFNFVSWAEYLRMPQLNFSKLKLMAKGPRAYEHNLSHPIEQTPAMLEGSVVHKMVLEPDQFNNEYSIWKGGFTKDGKPTMSRNSSAYREFAENEVEAGRTVITEAMKEKGEAIRKAIMAHPVARTYLEGAMVEQTVVWERHGLQLKSRLDIVQGGFICDLKKTQSVDPHDVGRTTANMLYHAQMAFYRDAWQHHTGELLPAKTLMVEWNEPHRIGCYNIPEEALEEGQALYENWLKMLRECADAGKFPVVYPEEMELRLPSYALTASMDAETTLNISGEEMTL